MSITIMMGVGDDPWDRAHQKANDPNMSLKDNPLREDVDPNYALRRKNMDRLLEDARQWNDPKSGEIYRAIRSMVYNKGE